MQLRRIIWRFLCCAGLALMLALTGCEKTAPVVKASVNFRDVQGIQPGAAVTLNGVAVGKVAAVEPATQGAIVRLELDSAQASGVQQNATATIATAAGQTLVALNNPPQPAPPLADGAVLQASEPGKGLGDLIGAVVGTVKETLQQASDYFSTTNQQWQDAKSEMRQSLESMADQSKAAGKQLQQDLDKLFRDLESRARGLEATSGTDPEQIQAEYEALDTELKKQEEAFHTAGETDAAAKMEALRARLKAEVDRFLAQASP